MKTIHKFQLSKLLDDHIEIKSFRIVRWLKIDFQYDVPCIWAEVDLNSEIETRHIHIRGTGHPMQGVEGHHIGTLQFSNRLVFHYFADKGGWVNGD